MLMNWIACDVSTCGEPAHADVQWHSDGLGTQTGTMCKAHADELFASLNSLLKMNRASFRIDRVNVIRAEMKMPLAEPRVVRPDSEYTATTMATR